MTKLHDFIGQHFGRLIVLYRAPSRNYITYWHCRCSCGNNCEVSAANLKKGTQSCGCLWIEKCQRIGHLSTRIHGQAFNRTKTYMTWRGMKERCGNPKNISYKYYGAKGVRVCARWENSFVNFFADMGHKPDKHQLDRINPYGNYEPRNCRWATLKEQRANRRVT